MPSQLNQRDEKDTELTGWKPLVLPGLPGLRLLQRYDFADDRQALVLSVRIEPGRSILRYGMTRRDLGSAWHEPSRAQRRLKTLAEAQLRKDLFLFYEEKKVPRSMLQIEWINFKGRAIV
jgi:hypothetical protein